MAQTWHNIEKLAEYLRECREYVPGFDDALGICEYEVVAASGGWDPLHFAHVRHLQAAAKLGNTLVVIVNGDGFLTRKKGYVFMQLWERMEIMAALRCVSHVVPWDDGTQTVAGALAILRPNIFAKGGDRSSPEAMDPTELAVCRTVGCRVEYGVGGRDKPQSSGRLVEDARRHAGV